MASAYNLVALGTVDSSGNTLLPGDISDSADVEGRVAAADKITLPLVVNSNLEADPYGAAATYAFVSTNGLNSGEQYITINNGGSAYAPGTNGAFNFNGGGHRVTSGSSGINFTTLRSSLDSESLFLGSLLTNGQILVSGQTGFPSGANPSFLALVGTSPILNVFDLTASEFSSNNSPLDIVVPSGSTVVINVPGTADSFNASLYVNGSQVVNQSTAAENVLFNFASASSVTINAGLGGSVLAPFAVLSGNGTLDGNIVAAQIGQTGEVHNVEFTGSLPTPPVTSATPEPGSLVLFGTGILGLAGFVRSRRTI